MKGTKKKTGKKQSGEKQKKRRKILQIVLLVYLFLVAAAYIGGVVYYSRYFFRGSTINGMDCTGKTLAGVKESISDEILSYTLTIEDQDGQKEVITAPQIRMAYVEDGKLDELKKQQNPFLWFLAFAHENDYDMAVTTEFDTATLKQIVDGLPFLQEENMTAPQDAHLQQNEQGVYEIVPEVMGNQLDYEKTLECIVSAVKEGKTELSLKEEDCYIRPAVYSDDESLNQKMQQYNTYLSSRITYDFGGRQEVIDGNTILTWLAEDEQGNVYLDEEKVLASMKELAIKYDTFGLSRQFTTSHGETITLKGGDYGWCMNQKEEAAAVMEIVQNGQSEENRQPVYRYSAKDRSANDIGGTYVEVSISEQRMWCYKDGVCIVDTPVVTGNVSKQYDTPSGGCWAIDAKKKDAVLKGEGYSTPVTYWMPFNGNVGIHDADTWRSQYGGDIYLTNGSHGCVNTPYVNAEKIFNAVEIGTAVIVY
ncbi:MAG: peptidoglycan binding domain-containing protein [Lachnospiraceae bacterium]